MPPRRGVQGGRGHSSRAPGAVPTLSAAPVQVRKRPAAAAASLLDEVGGRRWVVRKQTAERELRQSGSEIGAGTRATVLFHETGFDSAMISLERVVQGRTLAELAERNHSTLEMLYFVVEAEDGKVEFELSGRGAKEVLSVGSEVLVPPGAVYTLRNLSRTSCARLVTVVPHRET